MRSLRNVTTLGAAVVLALAVAGCSAMQGMSSTSSGTALVETREIAKEAFLYGFPLVTNYETLYLSLIHI